jgi:hypothetical protein
VGQVPPLLWERGTGGEVGNPFSESSANSATVFNFPLYSHLRQSASGAHVPLADECTPFLTYDIEGRGDDDETDGRSRSKRA